MKKILILTTLMTLFIYPSAFGEEFSVTYNKEKVRFSADHVEYDQENNVLKGRGNFHLTQETSELHADEAEINLETKDITAQGHVMLRDKDVELYGDALQYNMEEKKGNIIEGIVYQRPWVIYGPKMEKVSEKKTISRHARITSCDLTPPHYYLSTSKVAISMDEYLFAVNSVMWVDDVPIFYVPVFLKSLGERMLSIDVRPGYSKREGVTVKSTLGMPLGPYFYGKLYIDYFELKGTGLGSEINYYRGDMFKGNLYGYNIKERDTLQERWTLRGSHWQRLNSLLYMQGNLQFQSDTDFNNTYIKDAYERVVQTIDSDLAFTAQTNKTTSRVVFERHERFDAVKQKFIPEIIRAPGLTFTTSRLELAKSRWYYTVNAGFDQIYQKTDEFYRKSGNANLSLTRNFNITRSLVFKPQFDYREDWKDRQADDDLRDLFNGRHTTYTSLRQRLTRWLDIDYSHIYTVRTMKNTIKTDSNAVDKGIEQNHGGIVGVLRVGRVSTFKVYSGYNFHKNKDEVVVTYKEKMDIVTYELQCRPVRNLSFSLRDIYDFYPRSNVGFSGDVQLFKLYTNWSYFKENKGRLNIYHSIECNVTKKTHIIAGIRYITSGPNRLNYDRVEFTEKTLALTRDLHCFEFKMSYIMRGDDSEEILFNLQLKVDMQRKKRLYDPMRENEFYPWRKG